MYAHSLPIVVGIAFLLSPVLQILVSFPNGSNQSPLLAEGISALFTLKLECGSSRVRGSCRGILREMYDGDTTRSNQRAWEAGCNFFLWKVRAEVLS